jgi:hypothetical protein
MVRVDTGPIAAQVIELETIRNWADVFEVEGTVRQSCPLVCPAHLAVAIRLKQGPVPYPAAVVCDAVSGEVVDRGLGISGAPRPVPARRVLVAHANALGGERAVIYLADAGHVGSPLIRQLVTATALAPTTTDTVLRRLAAVTGLAQKLKVLQRIRSALS